MSGNPLDTELPQLLTDTLLAIEAARRDPATVDESVDDALGSLERLESHVSRLPSGALRDAAEKGTREAREALEEKRVEEARECLLQVGRAIDRYLKGELG